MHTRQQYVCCYARQAAPNGRVVKVIGDQVRRLQKQVHLADGLALHRRHPLRILATPHIDHMTELTPASFSTGTQPRGAQGTGETTILLHGNLTLGELQFSLGNTAPNFSMALAMSASRRGNIGTYHMGSKHTRLRPCEHT